VPCGHGPRCDCSSASLPPLLPLRLPPSPPLPCHPSSLCTTAHSCGIQIWRGALLEGRTTWVGRPQTSVQLLQHIELSHNHCVSRSAPVCRGVTKAAYPARKGDGVSVDRRDGPMPAPPTAAKPQHARAMTPCPRAQPCSVRPHRQRCQTSYSCSTSCVCSSWRVPKPSGGGAAAARVQGLRDAMQVWHLILSFLYMFL
jgi:hypothetical protein